VNRPRTTGKDLPPRLLERRRTLKSGKLWVGYYYDGRDEHGKRREIPLGTDLALAKAKWAELEHKPPPAGATTRMAQAWAKYIRDVLPTKAVKTRSDQVDQIGRLMAAFRGAEFEQITSAHVAQYRDGRRTKARTLASGEVVPSRPAPVVANRELAVLSHMWNKAREWGYTNAPNPVQGVSKNKETPRDFYADDTVWHAVRDLGVDELQVAMDLAYLTGQRPSDMLKFGPRDIVDDALEVQQGKTGKRLRIMLTDAATGARSQLGQLIDRLLQRKVVATRFVVNEHHKPIKIGALRDRFNDARAAAVVKAKAHGDHNLAARVQAFQFRDARAKAATEIDNIGEASKLLAHSSEAFTKRTYRRRGERVNPTR
jgi:integrase